MTKTFFLYETFWIFLELFVLFFAISLQKFFERYAGILSNQVFYVSSPAGMDYHFNI